MDGLDMGDAMGVIIGKTFDEYYEFSVIREEFTLHSQIIFDSFQWKDIRERINFNIVLSPSDIGVE